MLGPLEVRTEGDMILMYGLLWGSMLHSKEMCHNKQTKKGMPCEIINWNYPEINF